jgi:ribosome-binding factor A
MGNPEKSRQRSIGSGIRVPRLEVLFRDELSSLFDGEINDARLSGVRITRVELSRDGSRARVWFDSLEPHVPREELQSALQRASGFLRSRLAEALPLKRTPELSFRRDLRDASALFDSEKP